jgi:hypothetical protein
MSKFNTTQLNEESGQKLSSELENKNYSYNTIRTGFLGSIQIIIYLIMYTLFAIIIVTNKSKLDDVPAGTGTLKNYSVPFNWLCAVGILLCLIRIVWTNSFFNTKQSSRIMELLFGLIIWGLFIATLIFSLKNKSQLDAIVAGTNNTITAAQLKTAKDQNRAEYISCSIGIALSTLYTIYNIYYLTEK